jgi:ubiquitin-protein ligase
MGSYNTFYYNERLEKERNEFLKWKKTICCDGNPQRGDSVWNIIMDGPLDSPYMGGKFKIKITFQKDYPNSNPKFEFMTPICHINIEGNTICLGSLNNYEKNTSIITILSQIFMMLTSPNEQSAFKTYGELYVDNYSGYLKKAREMTKEYAKI